MTPDVTMISDALFTPGATMLATGSPEGGFWLPPDFSEQARLIDVPFMFITWVCIFFFVLIVVLMCYFAWRYNRARGVAPDHRAATHHTLLEVTWSGIPLIISIGMFYVGFKYYMDLAVAPSDAYTINLTAQRWSWLFEYPNGHQTNELHVPANEPVRIVMSSKDVIHSFFVPDFRVKQDVVPGRFSMVWFEAKYDPNPRDDGKNPNVHHLFCAEFCGTSHSDMLSTVTVHATRDDYEAWLESDSDPWRDGPPPEAVGNRLYNTLGCVACHTVDGTPHTGPSLKNTWAEVTGGARRFSEGAALDTSDPVFFENYIFESLTDPMTRIVDGFPKSMSTFRSQLDDRDIGALVAYIKWLTDNDGSRDLWAEWKEELEGRNEAAASGE